MKHAREVDGKSTAVHAPIIGILLFTLIILTKETCETCAEVDGKSTAVHAPNIGTLLFVLLNKIRKRLIFF